MAPGESFLLADHEFDGAIVLIHLTGWASLGAIFALRRLRRCQVHKRLAGILHIMRRDIKGPIQQRVRVLEDQGVELVGGWEK